MTTFDERERDGIKIGRRDDLPTGFRWEPKRLSASRPSSGLQRLSSRDDPGDVSSHHQWPRRSSDFARRLEGHLDMDLPPVVCFARCDAVVRTDTPERKPGMEARDTLGSPVA